MIFKYSRKVVKEQLQNNSEYSEWLQPRIYFNMKM